MFDREKEKQIIRKSHLFDSFYYLKENRDVRLADIDPLSHFIQSGWKEGREPSLLFNTIYYLDQNPDVKAENINPLFHYLLFGFYEDRKPTSNAEAYSYWCLFTSHRKGFRFFIQKWKDALTIHKSGFFDKDFYLKQNPDIYEAFTKSIYWKWRDSHNPLLRAFGRFKTSTVFHYVFHGVYEGRDPSSTFSTAFYINQYPDLRKVKVRNPFVHYICRGRAENRLTIATAKHVWLTDLLQYSSKIIQECAADQKTKMVSVITEIGDDLAETRKRLENILDQSHLQIEVLLLQWQTDPSVSNLAKEYTQNYPKQFKLVTTTKKKKDDGSMWKDALQQATSEFIWFVPQGSTCDQNFLDELLVFFADECVMAAFCPTHSTGFLSSFQQQGTFQTESWVKSAVHWVNQAETLDEELRFQRGAWIVRNAFSSSILAREVPNICNDEDFRNFLLEFMVGGAVAFSSLTTHWTNTNEPDRWQDRSLDQNFWLSHQQFLSTARCLYQVPLEKIKANYEKERSKILIHEPSKIDEFIKSYKLDTIAQIEPKTNIMISIVAFSLGGGEIMPIRLANQLKQMGYAVTVHSMRLSERVSKVREMLDPDIPVVTTSKIEEMALILKEFQIDVINTNHQANQSFIADVLNMDKDLRSRVFHVGTSHGMYESFSKRNLEAIFSRLQDGVDHWTYVADKNLIPFQEYGLFNEEKFTKIPNGMKVPETHPIDTASLGIPHGAFVACIASRAIPEKGWLQAVQATAIARDISGKDIHLILIGDGEIYEQLIKEGVPAYIHLLGFRDNPCDYFAVSDVCLIPSYYRSESAPLTLIEALLCHKPVISSDIGDVVKMLTMNGELAGDVFKLQDWTVPVEVLAQKIAVYAADEQLCQKKKALTELKAREFEISNVALRYLDVYSMRKAKETAGEEKELLKAIAKDDQMLSSAVHRKDSIRVSVIVPNYNHARYLRQRLDCIYDQTYRNFEVLLMDDCSVDGSQAILQEYAERYKENTRLLLNKKNSGGVYYQWAKGIQNASSEVCWIAETDDYCENNFLEKVLPAFNDPQVKLSYCQYGFVNTEGNENPGAFLGYVGTIDDEKWKRSYINDSSNEVETALAVKNTIPNVSGALFKKPVSSSLLEDNDWLSMRICGDWIFYLHIILGGKIAYTVDTKSYFRFHTSNTSVATYATAAYYKEHEMVACAIKSLYNVSDQAILRNYENIHTFFDRNVHDKNLVFEELFDIQKVLSQSKVEK
ncbi:MAG: glycosyltransferase [Anaerolineaceae bacterium]